MTNIYCRHGVIIASRKLANVVIINIVLKGNPHCIVVVKKADSAGYTTKGMRHTDRRSVTAS